MDALSRWVTQHRMTVGLFWLAITIVGIGPTEERQPRP
jgi:hypothetical protein